MIVPMTSKQIDAMIIVAEWIATQYEPALTEIRDTVRESTEYTSTQRRMAQERLDEVGQTLSLLNSTIGRAGEAGLVIYRPIP